MRDDEPPEEDAEAGSPPFPEVADDLPAPMGSRLGAIGQMAVAVLVVLALVALFVAGAVAVRWIFWR